MRILIACDKFKGSLTAREVNSAIREGVLLKDPSSEVVCIPMADGGEGTCDLLTEFSKGEKMKVTVMDPAFRKIESEYGISGDGKTAFIEMAKASGLQLLNQAERNPRYTTTYGTGQLILHALDQKVSHIILGIGGSATNDGGMGMASVLGFEFRDMDGEIVKPIGDNLIRVATIEDENIHPALQRTKFTVIFDVQNPLFGKNGAAHIFAAQKGASSSDIEFLDRGLIHFSAIVRERFNVNINFPGAGAGGGMSGGALVFLSAGFSAGIDFIFRFTDFESQVSKADLVITGEGKIDEQTLSGKVAMGVSSMAARYGKPCIAFAGKCELDQSKLDKLGLKKVITLVDENTSEQEAIRNAAELLKLSALRFL